MHQAPALNTRCMLFLCIPQGFSSEWFTFYYNQNGGQPYPKVGEERPAGSKETGYLTTPRLTAYARVRLRPRGGGFPQFSVFGITLSHCFD
jgi:hypothetical protein